MEKTEKERGSRETELRILRPKDFQPLHDTKFEHQSLLYLSGQGEPAGQRSVRGEASLSHLCLSPIKGNREPAREQVSQGERGDAVPAWVHCLG